MDGASQDSGHAGRRKSKRPPQMKFMFIDSSEGGTNAKPDKAVRSFVMHQARRSKPWSTRQKSAQTPKSASDSTPASELPTPQLSPAQDVGRAEHVSPNGHVPWQIVPSPREWNDRPVGSPVSRVGSTSSSTSTNSRHNSNTPTSTRGSVCNLPQCPGSCGRQHLAVARRDGFALGVLDPFDCLPIRVDAKTSSLLDHCKPTNSKHPSYAPST